MDPSPSSPFPSFLPTWPARDSHTQTHYRASHADVRMTPEARLLHRHKRVPMAQTAVETRVVPCVPHTVSQAYFTQATVFSGRAQRF